MCSAQSIAAFMPCHDQSCRRVRTADGEVCPLERVRRDFTVYASRRKVAPEVYEGHTAEPSSRSLRRRAYGPQPEQSHRALPAGPSMSSIPLYGVSEIRTGEELVAQSSRPSAFSPAPALRILGDRPDHGRHWNLQVDVLLVWPADA